MAKFKKFILCVICSFFTLFLSIGYASLSNDFHVDGTVILNPQSGVFITNASVDSGNVIIMAIQEL